MLYQSFYKQLQNIKTSTNIAVTLRRFFSNEEKLIKSPLEAINNRLDPDFTVPTIFQLALS